MGAKEDYCWEPAGGQPWDQELGGGDMSQPASLPPGLGWGQSCAGAAGGPPAQVKKSDPLRAWRTPGWLLPGTVPLLHMSGNKIVPKGKKEAGGGCAAKVPPSLTIGR